MNNSDLGYKEKCNWPSCLVIENFLSKVDGIPYCDKHYVDSLEKN